MTQHPKNNAPRDAAGECRRGTGSRAWRSLCRVFCWTHRTASAVVLTIVLVLLYLDVVGLPRFAETRLLGYLADQGLHLAVRRVRLGLFEGVMVDGLKFYKDARATDPLLEADRIVVRFSPRDWLERQSGFAALRVKGATLRINTGTDPGQGGRPQNLVLDRVNGVIDMEPDGVRLLRVTSDFVGIRLRGEGFVRITRRTESAPFALRELSRTLAQVLDNMPSWMPGLAEQVNAVRFEAPPKAEFHFTLDPTDPVQTKATLDVAGFGTEIRGVTFDRWTLQSSAEKGVVRVASFSAVRGNERWHASGSLRMTNGMAEARIYSTLSPGCWIQLLPESWGGQVARQGIACEGKGAFEAWLGPAPVTNVLECVTGWVELEQVDFRNLWVEKGFVQIRRQDGLITFERIDAVLGRGRQQGSVEGNGTIHLDSTEYSFQATMRCDPTVLLPLLSSNQADVIAELEFRSAPRADLQISGVITNPPSFEMTGHLVGTNFSFRGVAVDLFDAGIEVTNSVMTFKPMLAVRPEGKVTGYVAVDFERSKADFDAEGVADPFAVARVIGSNVHEFLSRYRFEGPVRGKARGVVDYGTYEGTDVDAVVEGEKVGMGWFLADRASCHIVARGTRLDFLDVEGEVYGGTFSGSVSIWDYDKDDVGYSVRQAVTNMILRQVVAAVRDVDREVYKGRLSGVAEFSGLIGDGQGKTVEGKGVIDIREGSLFQIPLLGGLSQFLSRIYPGLGFATQTDFHSPFAIADGKVSTLGAELEGSILSASGVGVYHFDERLDLNVQVKLLRPGVVASVLRLITFPVTKVLEFHLGGRLTDPKWRPRYLPKELFLIFD